VTVRRFELRLVDKDGGPTAHAETKALIEVIEAYLVRERGAFIRKRSRGVEPVNGYYLRALTFHLEVKG
jgi:hypothetical protein